MRKWTGGLLITALGLILFLRYSFMGKSPQKQSAYDFFHYAPVNIVGEDHDAENGVRHNVQKTDTGVGKSKLKETTVVMDSEGLSDLYVKTNISREESKALLVWGKMRQILSRADPLPEMAQGIKEAAVAWKELMWTIEENKASNDGAVRDKKDCPYFVNGYKAKNSSEFEGLVHVPCGLIDGSSITVIGIPDAREGSFSIELIGSQLPEEPKPPIVLQYNVVLPGENLTKEPVIIQKSWTGESGWSKEEKCPRHGSLNVSEVDGLVKCNAQNVRLTIEVNPNANFSSNKNSSSDSNESAHGSANFPFLEGSPFTATLWAGIEGFHMTVNGRHETSFAYREKLEPWLVSRVGVKGGVNIMSIIAKGLPVSEDADLIADAIHLKAPSISTKKLILLIGVFSSGNNFERRMALRRSWMQYEAVRSRKVAVRFFIGLHKNKQVNYELWKEAQAFGDIQLVPFIDYYNLLSLKTIAICIMGIELLPAKYVMKIDDDAFVRVDEVISSLESKASNGLVYGHISFESGPQRDKENKWYISPEEWPHSTYPPWAHGPGYILSQDIAKFIVEGHNKRDLMFFKLEDVAVGIWVEQFKKRSHKVEYINDDKFNIAGCESNYILAHYQSPRMVLCLWEKLQKEHEPHCCE